MGKVVVAIVAVVAVVAIAIFAPELAPMLAHFATTIGISLSATAALAITTAALTLVATLGVGLLQKALIKGSVPQASQTATPQVFRQSITDSFIVYGKRRVGGLLVFFHARVSGSDHFRYFVIAVAGHRCKGVVSWMLNDETVTVDGSGKVTSGTYANAAWLFFQRGLASETANATFVSECGGNWTTNHKGSGVAAIYAKFQMTDAAVQAGMPNITAVIEGRDEILDPRTGTVGYSRNAVLIFYDWMQLARQNGGFGAYDDEIPNASWISAQANVCDETVSGNPRYAFDIYMTTGAAPSEVRDAMIVNCAGSYTYTGGKHLMRPGYWVPVTMTLEEKDLAGPIQVTPFMTSDASATQVQGTYISAADGYQGMPFTTWTRPGATDIRQLDLDLAFITVLDQADRVAAIMGKRAACEKGLVLPMNIMGIKTRVLDYVQFNSARYGLNNYAWVVANWGLSFDPTAGPGVVLTLREENAEIYDAPTPVTPSSPPTIVQPSGPIISPSPVVVGPAQANILYDNSGVTFQSADDLIYKVQDGSGTVTSGVAMTYTVVAGTFNGLTSASGAQTLTLASGIADITPTALTTDTATLQINATLNGVALPGFLTTANKIRAAATPTGMGGGGGGTTDVASQSSGFTAINTATFTTITSSLTFTLPTGKTTLRCVVDLTCKYPRSADQSGPWDVEFKVKRGGVDQGTTQHSNPDPVIDTSSDYPIPNAGTMQYTLDMTSLTALTQYTVVVQARVATGTLPSASNMTFSGTVTLSAP